jgi:hypothetical protein
LHHDQEENTAEFPDNELLDHALKLGRIVFSQDKDFLIICTWRQRSGIDFGGVVYASQLRLSVGQIIRDLHFLATILEPEEMTNQLLWLPL